MSNNNQVTPPGRVYKVVNNRMVEYIHTDLVSKMVRLAELKVLKEFREANGYIARDLKEQIKELQKEIKEYENQINTNPT